MKSLKKIYLTVLTLGAFAYFGYAGCNNEPDSNNGDCTYSTSGGNTTYFCGNSWAFHDCVKSSGGDDDFRQGS